MSRPSLLSRVCGTPRMAMLLLLVYATLVIGCYENRVPGLLAFLALLAAWRTLSAVGQVRRYNAWAAKWQAVGEQERPQARRKKARRRGWMFNTGMALLVVAIPLYIGYLEQRRSLDPWLPPDEALTRTLTLVWCAVCLYLAFVLLRGLVRLMTRRKAKAEVITPHKQADDDAVVTCPLPPASSSPSREMAQHELPDYCARLMGAQP